MIPMGGAIRFFRQICNGIFVRYTEGEYVYRVIRKVLPVLGKWVELIKISKKCPLHILPNFKIKGATGV